MGLLDDGRDVVERSGDPRFAPATGGEVSSSSKSWLDRVWYSLPPEARRAYMSGVGALGELSPGAAIRDTLQESGEGVGALLQGRGWDAAGHGAGLLTAMAGVVPINRAISKTTKAAPAVAREIERSVPQFTEAGLPVNASSPAFRQAVKEAKETVEAAGKGAGPLDLRGDQRIPGIAQEAIPRYEPPRGISPRLADALKNPKVEAGIVESIKEGQKVGAENWYLNNPLYQAFTKELGEAAGHKEFMKYMDYQSAASPRSDVPTNIRNASYYFVNEDKLPGGGTFASQPPNPQPYGHIAQGLHRQNADVVRADVGDWGGYDIMKNPKPPSYGANLGGNLLPVAVDSHNFKNIAMRTDDPRFLATSYRSMGPVNPFASKIDQGLLSKDELGALTMAQRYGEPAGEKGGKYITNFRPQQLAQKGLLPMDEATKYPSFWEAAPNANEYGAAERYWQDIARGQGLEPAMGQSAGWSGGGQLTGLGTPADKTFGQMHNERVLYTAKVRGEDPEDTLRYLIRKQKPLLSLAGPGLLAPVALWGAKEDEPQY